jgi:hypothetical protein
MPRTTRNTVNTTIPPYVPTQSLNMRYTFKYETPEGKIIEDAVADVPVGDNHLILQSGCENVLSLRKKMYKSKVDDANFANAIITFLYTDTLSEEGYLSEEIEKKSFILKTHHQNYILSCLDMYEEIEKQPNVAACAAARNREFNTFLTDRVASFASIADDYAFPFNKTIYTVAQLEDQIKGGIFHQTFHHSEQGIMHYLSSPLGQKYLTKTAISCGAAYMYGCVLDIYSQRTLCCNCNACLLGMQNSHTRGFLADFSKTLQAHNIETRENGQLMLNARVSASKAHKGTRMEPFHLAYDFNVVHEYNPDVTNKIYQARVDDVSSSEIIDTGQCLIYVNKNDYSSYTYGGTLFASNTSAAKDKLEKRLREINEVVNINCATNIKIEKGGP